MPLKGSNLCEGATPSNLEVRARASKTRARLPFIPKPVTSCQGFWCQILDSISPSCRNSPDNFLASLAVHVFRESAEFLAARLHLEKSFQR